MDIFSEINTLCSFWDDDGDETYRVGFFLGEDDYALFNLISTRGHEDGLYLTLKENIYRIDKDDSYTLRMKKLFELQKQTRYSFEFNKNESLLTNLLKLSRDSKRILTIFLSNDDTVTGVVKQIRADSVEIRCVNDDGEYDGNSCISLPYISKIRFDAGEERILKSLSDCAR